MIDVSVERMIPLPPEAVAQYAMDWRHDAEWTQGIREASLVTEPEGGFGVGAEVRRTAFFLGRRIDYVLHVRAYEPPSLLDMVSVAGPFPMQVTYRFDRQGSDTLASIRVRGGKGLMGLIGGPLVRRNLRKDLRDLEARMTRVD